MDDKNFQKDSAVDWITAIESSPSSARDHDIYPLLQEWIIHSNPSNVLDIGCGQGICSSKLNLKECKYIGVDPSPVLIDRAKELNSNAGHEFIMGNIYSLPFESSSFDAVFSVAVWHLLEDVHKASEEVSRILKSSGKILLIMADPSAYSAWTKSYEHKKIDGIRFEGTIQRQDGSKSTDILYLREKDEIVNELEVNGIRISSIKSFRNQIAIQGYKGL